MNASKSHKGTILLVSDFKKSNHILVNKLLPNGYQVVVAHDGFDALHKLRSLTVDLIITRLKLPKMDCLELMMNLRDLNITCPVIILEEKDARQADESSSIVDVLGYGCCCSGIQRKMVESILTQ